MAPYISDHLYMYYKLFLTSAILSVVVFCFISKKNNDYGKYENNHDTQTQIDLINKKNKFINNISCKITTQISTTHVFYQKPSIVYSETKSMLGIKQLEVASDGVNYWFWSNSMDKKSVYHCLVSELSNTRVVFPLWPNIIKSALVVDDLNNFAEEEDLIVTKDQYFVRKIKIKEGNIAEISYSHNQIMILSIYVQSFQEVEGLTFPKKMKLKWHEQASEISAEMTDIRINIPNPPDTDMPRNMKKVSLKDY